jgi:hypothetical protein
MYLRLVLSFSLLVFLYIRLSGSPSTDSLVFTRIEGVLSISFLFLDQPLIVGCTLTILAIYLKYARQHPPTVPSRMLQARGEEPEQDTAYLRELLAKETTNGGGRFVTNEAYQERSFEEVHSIDSKRILGAKPSKPKTKRNYIESSVCDIDPYDSMSGSQLQNKADQRAMLYERNQFGDFASFLLSEVTATQGNTCPQKALFSRDSTSY